MKFVVGWSFFKLDQDFFLRPFKLVDSCVPLAYLPPRSAEEVHSDGATAQRQWLKGLSEYLAFLTRGARAGGPPSDQGKLNQGPAEFFKCARLMSPLRLGHVWSRVRTPRVTSTGFCISRM